MNHSDLEQRVLWRISSCSHDLARIRLSAFTTDTLFVFTHVDKVVKLPHTWETL